MSKATKRKHVYKEALEENLDLPEKNQQIVKVLGSRGNNLHEVQSSDQTFLISMPNKFRKNIWIKKGDFILVEPIEEGEKVKAEMVKVLRPDYIKFLKNNNAWPEEFSENNSNEVNAGQSDEFFVNSNQTQSDSSQFSSDESD